MTYCVTFGVDVYTLKQLTVFTYCMTFVTFVADDVNSQVANCVYTLHDLRGSFSYNLKYILHDTRD